MRPATCSQNRANTKFYITNTSGYRGVYYDKDRDKWKAVAFHNYKKTYIGRFNTPEEAALAYNRAAIIYHGEFAVLNIVDEGKQ